MNKFGRVHRRLLIGMLLLLLSIAPAAGIIYAQNLLNYGDSVQGALSAQAPLAFYNFNGNQGDLVSVTAIGLTPGLQPTVSLLGPSGTQLGFNASDLITILPNDATVTYRLETSGTHTVLVGSTNFGTVGDFVIFLSAEAQEAGTTVSEDGPVSAEIQPTTAQVFNVDADPDGPTVVNFASDPAGFLYTVYVRNPSGQLVATLDGSIVQNSALTLAAAEGVYRIRVVPNGNTTGTVSVTVGAAAPPPAPQATEEAAAPPDENACRVAVTTASNVYSGPSTGFDVVGQMTPNEFYLLRGRSNLNAASLGSSTDFFLIDFITLAGATIDGWIPFAAFLIEGDCTEVPQFVYEETTPESPAPVTTEEAAPAATEDVVPPVTTEEVAPPTATNIPTNVPPPATTEEVTGPTQAPVVQATPTYTPSYTAVAPPTTAVQPTQVPPSATAVPVQATPTYTPSYTPTTPPAAQLAPADARFNNPLNIPLDNTVSVLDFVSYPEGDTEDRVRWDITGMNSNSVLSGGRARLVISVSCFGENTDQIQFFTGGQTYACGQTIVDREVTFNSKTGSVVITAVGGQGTYVQWVLTGTATRVN